MNKERKSIADLSLLLKKIFKNRRPLRVNILLAFVGLLIGTVLIIACFSYYNNSKAIMEISYSLIKKVNDIVIEKTVNYLEPASLMSKMGSRIAENDIVLLLNTKRLESFAVEILKTYPQLSMFNIGDEYGNFLMPKKLSDGTIATKIIKRSKGFGEVVWKYRDTEGNVTNIKKSGKVKYDPRIRPWYKGAKESGSLFWTDMYVFFTDKVPGITSAYPVYTKSGALWGVFSFDIVLGELSNFLKELKISKNGVAFIINKKNEIVAYHDITSIFKKAGNKLIPIKINEFSVKYIVDSYKVYKTLGPDKQFTFKSKGITYLASYTSFPKSFGKDWKIAVLVPENDFIGPLKITNIITFIISLGVLIIAIIAARMIAKSVSRPIVALSNETKRIKNFDLEGKLKVKSHIKEIQLMTRSLTAMKNGLLAFKKYVPADLVRQLIKTGQQARLGGKKEELSIFFSDIAGFTTISESMTPEKLMIHLSEYLDELTKIIQDQKGTVDKYIGDAIMAFWGAPVENKDHAFHACRTALLCQEKLKVLNEKWKNKGLLPFYTRIGINTGETIVGNMGSAERMNYTVIGDNVNLASRLEGVNKLYGTHIMVSHSTYERVSDKFIFRPVDIVAVKGKKKGIKIYELLSEMDSPDVSEYKELSEVFTLGFKIYLKQKWNEALNIFKRIAKKYPSDKVTEIYISRCRELKKTPPEKNWDGIIRLKTK